MRLALRILATAILSCVGYATVMSDDLLILDDRRTGDYRSSLGTSWRLITDSVMGGVSIGQLTPDTLDDRSCLRLRGDVSLKNNGGFLQATLNVEGTPASDASAYQGVLLDVYGNDESYNLHLRTSDIWLPWQSYRASFTVPAGWHTVRLGFTEFTGYRIASPLDLELLERIGIVAIGRAFKADLCVAGVALYRDASR